MNGPEPVSYAEAMAELNSLLAEVERDDADIDQLAARVERGAALIQWCRARVDAAQHRIDEILLGDEPGSAR